MKISRRMKFDGSIASGVVVFLRASFHERAHVIFGLETRVIAVDLYLFSQRVHTVNLYAPTQRNLSPGFLHRWICC